MNSLDVNGDNWICSHFIFFYFISFGFCGVGLYNIDVSQIAVK